MNVMYIKPRVEQWNNSVTIKANRRRVEVGSFIAKEDNDETATGKNAIAFKALVSDVGAEPGVKHVLSDCNRIKRTVVYLTDEALLETYVALKHYFETDDNHGALIRKQYQDDINQKLKALSTNEQ